MNAWNQVRAGFCLLTLLTAALALGQSSEPAPGGSDLIQPAELVKALQSRAKPTIFYVGPRLIFLQAHIPGAEDVGPASKAEGIDKLRRHASSLARDRFVVIYCGCCPWEHCPNIRPAFAELRRLGFTRVKMLYLATSFGSDWVEKGYPEQKGE